MNQRLETFCDGVFAIAITLLILDIKVPPLESVHSVADVWRDVGRLWPSFFALSLSFVIIFISWTGHHNLLKNIDKTSPQFQFANGFFLFTVIIIPFPTAFMAEYLNTAFAQPAIVVYCLASLLHSIGWNLLERSILIPIPLVEDPESIAILKNIMKGTKIGFLINLALVMLAWFLPYLALALSILIWIYWLYISVSIKHERHK